MRSLLVSAERILSVACAYSHDAARLAALCGWSTTRVQDYLRHHGLTQDDRIPREWVVGRDGNLGLASVFAMTRRLCEVVTPHAAYRFAWPRAVGSWHHAEHVGSCHHDLETYHRLVSRATRVHALRYREILLCDVDDRGDLVMVRRLALEDGWGRGAHSVPWQIMAHPVNLCFLPSRNVTACCSTVEPTDLYEMMVAWNREHGTVLLDVSSLEEESQHRLCG